jgi:hypothetical protein
VSLSIWDGGRPVELCYVFAIGDLDDVSHRGAVFDDVLNLRSYANDPSALRLLEATDVIETAPAFVSW